MKALAVLGLLLITWPCWATTWYVSPGETYETFAAFHAAINPSPGDIIDGGGNTFNEMVVVEGGTSVGYVTYQNAIINNADNFKGVAGDWGWNATKNAWGKTGTLRTYPVILDGMQAMGCTSFPMPDGDGYYRVITGTPDTLYLSGNSGINPVDRWSTIETTANPRCIDIAGESYVRIKNMTLDFGGVELLKIRGNCTHFQILDCEFYRSTSGIHLYASGGDVNHVLIAGNHFDEILATSIGIGYHGPGIHNQGSSNVEVCHNTWDGDSNLATGKEHHCGGVFYHQEWTVNNPKNIKVHHNEITNFGFMGIYVKNMNNSGGIYNANTQIYANTIYSTPGTELGANGYSIAIKGQNATNYMTNVDIYQNHISNAYRSGIACGIYAGVDSHVWGNYLYNSAGLDDNGTGGIEGRNGAKIFNNTIYSHINGGSGIRLYAEDIAGCSNTEIFNNILYGAGTNQADSRGVRSNATNDGGSHNWFYDIEAGKEMSGITLSDNTTGINPLIVDEHLTIDSPCRNAGIEVFGVLYPIRDIDGQRVMPGSNATDIGCDEFHIETTGISIPEIF